MSTLLQYLTFDRYEVVMTVVTVNNYIINKCTAGACYVGLCTDYWPSSNQWFGSKQRTFLKRVGTLPRLLGNLSRIHVEQTSLLCPEYSCTGVRTIRSHSSFNTYVPRPSDTSAWKIVATNKLRGAEFFLISWHSLTWPRCGVLIWSKFVT